jgi:hypothetical protein
MRDSRIGTGNLGHDLSLLAEVPLEAVCGHLVSAGDELEPVIAAEHDGAPPE